MDQKSLIEKYCRRTTAERLRICVSAAVVCSAIVTLIIMLILGLKGIGAAAAVGIVPFIVFTLIFTLVVPSAQKRVFNTMWSELEREGLLPALIGDFTYGARFFGDSIIVGQTFMIGKGTCVIVKCGDIQAVQYKNGTTPMSNDPAAGESTVLNVTLNDGRTVAICSPYKGTNPSFAIGEKFRNEMQQKQMMMNDFAALMQSKAIPFSIW